MTSVLLIIITLRVSVIITLLPMITIITIITYLRQGTLQRNGRAKCHQTSEPSGHTRKPAKSVESLSLELKQRIRTEPNLLNEFSSSWECYLDFACFVNISALQV